MKLTPPAPQHPKRRHDFFKEHLDLPHAEYEIQKLENKHKSLRRITMKDPKIQLEESNKFILKRFLKDLFWFTIYVVTIPLVLILIYAILSWYGIGAE